MKTEQWNRDFFLVHGQLQKCACSAAEQIAMLVQSLRNFSVLIRP